MIKELVTYVIKQLVSNPNDVVVTVVKSGNTNVIEIAVNEHDRGKVIGKEGQTIKAVRMLVNSITPADKKVSIDIAK